MTLAELDAMLRDDTTRVVVVRDAERIVGMATLYIIPKIGKKNGLLEDVIVSADYRGQGLGERLVRTVLEMAKSLGLVSITLTSNPVRVAAHRLYQKVGFVIKDSDVMRIML
jgi:phosphinothricin acetyltransferase